jgi:hypothetical protein
MSEVVKITANDVLNEICKTGNISLHITPFYTHFFPSQHHRFLYTPSAKCGFPRMHFHVCSYHEVVRRTSDQQLVRERYTDLRCVICILPFRISSILFSSCIHSIFISLTHQLTLLANSCRENAVQIDFQGRLLPKKRAMIWYQVFELGLDSRILHILVGAKVVLVVCEKDWTYKEIRLR